VPDRYQRTLLDELVDQLAEVRRALHDAELRHAKDLASVPAHERDSARNLVHYLALRRFDLRPVQRRLTALGLSSLGRCESQVLASLDAVLVALHRLADRPIALEPAPAPHHEDFGTPDQLERRSAELLGAPREGRSVRVMVTMPGEAARDPSLARDLVRAGMDLARINSAHDDAETWAQVAAHVRRAAELEGRPCRVLFDLAGPKLRTGEFGGGASVTRVKPRRDARGLVLEPARVRLHRGPAIGAPMVEVPVEGELFAHARVGDVIAVQEPVMRKRRLVVEAVEADAVIAHCDRSVRFESGRPLSLEREGEQVGASRIGALPPRPEPILLFRGDQLLVGDERLAPREPLRDQDGRALEPGQVPSTLGAALDQVRIGDPISFDDGRIGGTVAGKEPGLLRVQIELAPVGGAKLGPDKGINLPNTSLDLPRPTAQDIVDLGFAVRHVDMVGFSFVERPQDVLRLEELLAERNGAHLGIVLKIETRRAFEALPQLLLTGLRSPPLGVMVARGDLAVEVGFSRLAEVQEEILWLCEAAHVPVIWATQVLETLAKTGLPTRAEVSDAAMGVRAECVMLNKGPFIVDAVHMLDDVLRRMQEHQHKKRTMLRRLRSFAE
jgi:pyruvate kinase